MLRKTFIIVIVVLIISTTFIKNHTKKIDEEIFSAKESIDYLNSVKELVQLEYDYLSSPEKLNEFNSLYFDNELRYTPKENIEIITNVNEISFGKQNRNEQ